MQKTNTLHSFSPSVDNTRVRFFTQPSAGIITHSYFPVPWWACLAVPLKLNSLTVHTVSPSDFPLRDTDNI